MRERERERERVKERGRMGEGEKVGEAEAASLRERWKEVREAKAASSKGVGVACLLKR